MMKKHKLPKKIIRSYTGDYTVYYYLTHPWVWLRAWRLEIRDYIHRGLYGWGLGDSYSLDSYLCGTVPYLIDSLIESSNGCPIDFIDNPDEWDVVLYKIRDGFRAAHIYMRYDDKFYGDGHPKIKALLEAKREAGFDLFKKHFYSLWY